MGWGDAFNDFMDHLWNMEEAKRERGAKEAILESKSLIRGHRINNSPGKTKISGPLADRITEALIVWKERKSETDLRIGKIKKGLRDVAKQMQEQKQGKAKQYKEKRKQIQEQVKKLEEKGNNNTPCGGK